MGGPRIKARAETKNAPNLLASKTAYKQNPRVEMSSFQIGEPGEPYEDECKTVLAQVYGPQAPCDHHIVFKSPHQAQQPLPRKELRAT